MLVDHHRVVAPDGWPLSVAQLRAAAPRGVAILGHAMMVDRRTLLRTDRPCLAHAFAKAGFRVLVPDLRGHGQSGPGPSRGRWTYDELVADVGSYLRLADLLAPSEPIIIVGHSLFAHNALAYLGGCPDPRVKGVVLLAADVWQRSCEPNPAVWAFKRAVLTVSTQVCRWLGFMPASWLRLGNADESGAYWEVFWSLRTRPWRSEDGVDYQANLARMDVPTLHIVSKGDRLIARPASALRFTHRMPQREAIVVGVDARWPGLAPTHMGLATDPACEAVWDEAARWARELRS